ncbi:hypothetical protein ET475_08580 [Microbacterium protaetiae]|uniref:Uncharacterized protein n=1 Tax=Microbacterium protaetiae TaxID=2509458 RepID=A0A4P6EFW4_9MICO|nr:hypothetical protein [Microbacterium protaetiae]QAY60039.1 hypothetical protein ET475_08580 [Microbacterium protaetiae]
MHIDHHAGEAPDPRPGMFEQAQQLPVPAITFVPQPNLEGAIPSAMQRGNDRLGLRHMSVSFTYTLIRNPSDRAAPENFAELDDETQRALDELPHVQRPAWIVEMSERIRHPQLREAVCTNWFREHDERANVDTMLLEHINQVLRNSFPTERGWEGLAGNMPPAPDVTAHAIQRDARVIVNGESLDGIRIDTDPFVVGLGARLPSGGILTVIVPRDELIYLTLEFEDFDFSS